MSSAVAWTGEFKSGSELDACGGLEVGLALKTPVPLKLWENVLMSGPRYDRILASTALALILAAPLGAAAVAQEAAAPTTAESAAQRAAAKYANAALDAAITPQSKNESPAQAPELAGASIVVVSPAPAP